MLYRQKNILIFGIISFMILGIHFELWAQEKGKEDILFMEIPVVYASSKRLQPFTETASSVEIVTAEEIKRSGAISIADVLRNVAGVQVREASVSSHAIGVRGFADAQHVLITLNGSSAYLHHVNHTYVDFIPVGLEEIERIEIVKGPGAVFYGGSAFSGIINIITKTPKEIDGTHVNLAGGNWDTIRGNVIYGGSNKNLDYSFSVGHLGAKYVSPPRASFMNTHSRMSYGAGKLTCRLDEESSVSAEIRHAYTDDGISRHCTNIKNTYFTLRYDRPNFWVRAFYNKQFKNAMSKTVSVDDDNYELEIMRIFKWSKNITSIGGFAKRVNFTCRNVAGNQNKSHIVDYALKAENEYHATDQFILTFGGRIEYYSEVGLVGLGRGSIIYKPSENQRLRLTLSSGYYLPSHAQLYGWGDIFPFEFSPSLKEEKITSYELAYYGHLFKCIKLKAAIFYNDYNGLIHYDLSMTPTNDVDGYQRGLELGFDFLITDWLSGFANYSYQSIRRSDFSGFVIDPHNTLNLGIQAKSAKWSSNLTFHYVDTYYEIYDAANPALGLLNTPQIVDPYTTVDVRIAYRPTDNFEVALAALNLLRNIHYETNPTGWIGADKVDRRISMSISCKF